MVSARLPSRSESTHSRQTLGHPEIRENSVTQRTGHSLSSCSPAPVCPVTITTAAGVTRGFDSRRAGPSLEPPPGPTRHSLEASHAPSVIPQPFPAMPAPCPDSPCRPLRLDCAELGVSSSRPSPIETPRPAPNPTPLLGPGTKALPGHTRAGPSGHQARRMPWVLARLKLVASTA